MLFFNAPIHIHTSHPEVPFHKVKSLEGAVKCISPILRGFLLHKKAPQYEERHDIFPQPSLRANAMSAAIHFYFRLWIASSALPPRNDGICS
jgi:hypothetical protein